MIYNFEDLSFQILTVFRGPLADGAFEVAPRPYAAISFRVQGRGEFEIAGRHLSAEAGDILFVPADTPYKTETFGSEIIVVHLRDCNYFEPEVFRSENPEYVRMLFMRLLEDFSERRSVNRVKSMLYELFDKMEGERRTARTTNFNACLRYMEANFCDPGLEIGAVCAVGFMSGSSLRRAFCEHLGMPPKAYLCKLRMNRALELLVENRLSVKEIAFSCGFSDEKFFSRAFKEKYGFPPSHLRKSYNM